MATWSKAGVLWLPERFMGADLHHQKLHANIRALETWAEHIRTGGHTHPMSEVAGVLTGTATWDPASMAAGAQTTTTMTVTGAAVGDPVAVGFSQDLQGMQLTGYVSAANTVTVVLQNGTAGAIDLVSGTLRADVFDH
jgi:hypothetical protein